MQKMEKLTRGRPRKGRIGVPQTNLIDAITYVKKVYDAFGTASFSFGDMNKTMDITIAFAKRASGEFKQYGLLDKTTGGYWFVTDLGKRAVNGDQGAVLEVLQKLEIFADLYLAFKDQNITRGVIEDYLKKKWKGFNAALVASRYMDVLNHIKSLAPEKELANKPAFNEKIIQLKYALNPPTGNEIPILVDNIFEEFKNDNNSAIRTLVKSMRENKGKTENLRLLFDNFLAILSERYPIISDEKSKK